MSHDRVRPEHEKLLSNVIQVPDGNDKDDDGPGLTTCGIDRNYANVLNISLGFLLLFTAFQTTQMLASSLIGALGQYSLALVYVFFTFGGFFAPAICRRTGPRIGMFVGGLTYVVYVASLIYMVVPIILVTSALVGCGAAVLWTSQGMMMSLSTNNTNKTKYNSLFWGIFNLCVLPGNIAGHYILMGENDSNSTNTTHTSDNPFAKMVIGFKSPNSELFILLSIVGGVGLATLLLVRSPDPKSGNKPTLDTRPAWDQIKATVALIFDPKLICLIPLFTFTGVQMTMWASWFTRQIYKTNIGLVMCGFGVAEFIGGFTIGPFVEKFGRSPGLVIGATCGLSAMALTYIGSQDMASWCTDNTKEMSAAPCKEFTGNMPFYVAAVLYGLMDCTFQSVAAAICSTSFNATGNSTDAWALYRTFQALGAAICFFISPHLVVTGDTYSSSEQLIIEIVITTVLGYLAMFGHSLFCKYSVGIGHAKDYVSTLNPIYESSEQSVQHSPAVIHNGHLFSSAYGGDSGSGSISKSDSLDQATAAVSKMTKILKEAGSNTDQVIKATIYSTPTCNMEIVLAKYEEAFVQGAVTPPALTRMVVAELPHNSLVQIDIVAYV